MNTFSSRFTSEAIVLISFHVWMFLKTCSVCSHWSGLLEMYVHRKVCKRTSKQVHTCFVLVLVLFCVAGIENPA